MSKCPICKARKAHIACRICGDGKKRCSSCAKKHAKKKHPREQRPNWTDQSHAP